MCSRPFRGAAWYYAEYRYRPSDAFIGLLAERLGWSSNDRILDLGAGPAHVSLPLARFVGEVVAMDPEPEMVAEGQRRAAAAGIENISFVVGGSDDLAADLGPLTAVTISQAFHWMADQDRVLRELAALVDTVALIGYVKEPDYNLVWLGRPPWDAVREIARRHSAPGASAPPPHDPFPDILGRSAFSDVELVTHEYETVVHPSIEAAIGYQYSLGNSRVRDRSAFEAEVRAALADADTTPFSVRLVDSALVGRKA